MSEIQTFAQWVLPRLAAVRNEESIKQSCVLPFLQRVLGYDPTDPAEISPEHTLGHKTRADYAILRDGDPVAAVECKRPGGSGEDERLQLRTYFNAKRTVKLGVLTDGMTWEFFTDAENANLMDEQPFLSFRMDEVAQSGLDTASHQDLLALHKGIFAPDSLGEAARRRQHYRSILDELRTLVSAPSDTMVRALMANTGNGRRAITPVLREITQQAFEGFLQEEMTRRLKLPQSQTQTSGETAQPLPPPAAAATAPPLDDSFLDQVRLALAFACSGDKEIYDLLPSLQVDPRRRLTAVFWRSARSGRILAKADGEGGSRILVGSGNGQAAFATLDDAAPAAVAVLRGLLRDEEQDGTRFQLGRARVPVGARLVHREHPTHAATVASERLVRFGEQEMSLTAADRAVRETEGIANPSNRNATMFWLYEGETLAARWDRIRTGGSANSAPASTPPIDRAGEIDGAGNAAAPVS